MFMDHVYIDEVDDVSVIVRNFKTQRSLNMLGSDLVLHRNL